jgi:glycine cleavage system H lipoate-binding protein
MEKRAQKKDRQPIVFSMANDLCVWSRAGVIKSTKCINAFNCLGCATDQRVLAGFDENRKNAGLPGSATPRMQLLMKQGKCRHMLSGRISYGLCSYGYNCANCAFDQMMDDNSYLPNLQAPVVDVASGFKVARDHYYHFGHAWARVEYGGKVRVGIDDFALRLLGPQDEIDMPDLGSRVAQNGVQAVLKRDGNEAPTLSPVDGTVVAVNHKVLKDSNTVNSDPYGEGWLMVIQPSSLRNNLKNLFFGQESQTWVDDEYFRLQHLVADAYGEEMKYRMAATGGEAISDIYSEVPEIGWNRLVSEFLHSIQ